MLKHVIPSPLRRALGRFARDEEGTLSVEAVIILPLLLWGFLATFTFFDAYRVRNLALKANYAISDLLSREIMPVNMDYLLGLEGIYTFLTEGGDPAWVRVTVVRCTDRCDDPDARVVKRDWSKATDGVRTHSNTDIADTYDPVIPMIAKGERVIMVETMMHYEPPFSFGLTGIPERDFRDVVMTRPRFVPKLCWEGVDTCDNS